MTKRIQHDVIEVCKNTDPARNLLAACLADPKVAQHYELQWCRPEERDGLAAACADCYGTFDDPTHGRFARCTRKTAHVCKFA